MTAVPDTGLARTIPEAGRPVRLRCAVVRGSFDTGAFSLLRARCLGGPFEHVGRLDWRLDGVQGVLSAGGGS